MHCSAAAWGGCCGPSSLQDIDGNVLHINVQGLPNDETRDSDLVASAHLEVESLLSKASLRRMAWHDGHAFAKKVISNNAVPLLAAEMMLCFVRFCTKLQVRGSAALLPFSGLEDAYRERS